MSLTLSDGTVLHGTLHSTFVHSRLEGTCVDLESAYKQIPVHPAHSSLLVFSMKTPNTGEVEFFESCAMPFGATAAVHGFNRVSQALDTILVRIMGIPCTHNFDDYTFVSPTPVCEVAIEMAKEILHVLGWDTKDAKQAPISATVTALGVEFQLDKATEVGNPYLTVQNKPERVKDISELIANALWANKITPSEAARLRGRLVFANSQTFGRRGALAFHYLGHRVGNANSGPGLSQELRWALVWWKHHLQNSEPRKVPLGRGALPVILYTYGCCDPDPDGPLGLRAGYGGVMFDPLTGELEFFMGKVGPELMDCRAS